MNRYSFLASILMLFFISCNKDDNYNPEEDPLSVYVYAAGAQMNQDKFHAVYMKNKQVVPLPYVAEISTIATDIQVLGDDIYVIGYAMEEQESSYRNNKALLWKNGQAQVLNTPDSKSAIANALFISGNDIYVAGSYVPEAEGATSRAVVWKNGEMMSIGKSNVITRLEDIFVSDNDIHVVGYENHNPGIVSKYWKNGVETVLSQSEFTTYAKSIYVDGTDVYIVGYADSGGDRSMKLWKNDIPTNLISGTTVIRGLNVTVDNGDVYATGYEQVGDKYTPRVFKNNDPLPILHSNSGHSYAFSTQVLDGKVYVLGREDQNGIIASVVWEDGKEIKFLTNTTQAMELQSMLVVPKN